MKPLLALVLALSTATAANGQSRSIHGRIVDAASAPVIRARIAAMIEVGSTLTPRLVTESNGRGEFAFELPAGTRSLRITKASYASVTLPVPVNDQLLQVRLAPGAALTGRILDVNGTPEPSVFVRAVPQTQSGATQANYSAFTDDRGEFRIGGLPEGRYLVGTSREGSESSPPVTVRPGEQIEVPMSRMPAPTCAAPSTSPQRSTIAAGSMIRGRVVTPAGTAAICASVRLDVVTPQLPDSGSTLERARLQVASDDQGRFAFADVPPGVYTILAFRAGYLPGRADSIEVRPVQSNTPRSSIAADVTIRLASSAVITGVVYDESGEPVQDSLVQARLSRLVDGYPIMTGSSNARTDDLGRFRLFGLDSGRWIVSSALDGPSQPPLDRPLIFYPGTPDARLAVPVDAVAGRVRDGIDIQRVPFDGVTVSGIAVDVSGQPLAEGKVVMDVSSRSGAMKTNPPAAEIRGGRFDYHHVAPGEYVVQVVRNTGRTYEFGRAFVSVGDTPPAPLSIQMTEGRSVSGRVRLEDGSAPNALVRIRLTPSEGDEGPRPGFIPDAVPVGDDEFRADHVVGPNRFTLVNAPAGWYLKSVRIDGRETAEQPYDFGYGGSPIRDVEIVVSSAAGTLTGTLRNPATARRDFTVVVFSTNTEDWHSRSARVRFARATPDGRFTVTGIPPGSYYAAAIAPLDDVNFWQDRVPLNLLIGDAERVTINEGGVQDVVLEGPA